MIRTIVPLLTAIAVASSPGSASAASTPLPIAIRNARIVRVSGPDITSGTVVVRNGLIEAVGQDVTVPADAGVIDGTGLTIYPGFIDALSDWGTRPPPPPRPAGAQGQSSTQSANQGNTPQQANAPAIPAPTNIRGPEDRPQTNAAVRAADGLHPDDARLTAAHAAGYTTAAVFPSGGIFAGLGAMVNLAGERGGDMVIAQPIGQEVVYRLATGGFGRSFPGSLMGNISYVRQLFLDYDHYQAAQKAFAAHPVGNRRPAYDHNLEALGQSPRLLLPAVDVQQIERTLDFGKELKRPFILYGVHEAYRCIDEIRRAQVPVLVSLKWPEKPKDGDPAEIPNYRDLMKRDQSPAVPGMLAKAGVRFALYSDGIDSAADLRKAIKKAIDAGLPREQAIHALTLSAAAIYGLDDRLGSIDRGKIANLTVTRGDAFEEKTEVEYIFIDGQQFRPMKEPPKPPSDKPDGDKKPTPEDEEILLSGDGR